jgi:hypothetical protein
MMIVIGRRLLTADITQELSNEYPPRDYFGAECKGWNVSIESGGCNLLQSNRLRRQSGMMIRQLQCMKGKKSLPRKCF